MDVDLRAAGWVFEAQPCGVQELTAEAVAGATTVALVPNDRKPDCFEMSANLVCAAGVERYAEER